MTTLPAPPRLAVVTGGDSGTGKAVAELLATDGFDVGLTFQTDERGAQDTRAAVEQRVRRCSVARHDASSPDTGRTIEQLVGSSAASASSSTTPGPATPRRCSTSTSRPGTRCWPPTPRVRSSNAQVAARHMVHQGRGGRIINITSVHEHVPRYGAAAYGSAKRPGTPSAGPATSTRWPRPSGSSPHRGPRTSPGTFLVVDGGLSLMAAHGHDTAQGWREA